MDLMAIRRAAGFNGQGLADALGWDQGKVSRVELGKQVLDDVDLMTWLLACDVKKPRLRQLVEHNREVTRETWVLPYKSPTNNSRSVRREEGQAKAITDYSTQLVTSLLQTPEYTRALASMHHTDEARIEQIVDSRRQKQELLRGPDAPHVVFYIEETALLRPVGNEQVFHDQLMHLMFMADWTKISIRVLRTSVGEHTGVDGAFMLIQRRDKRWVVITGMRTAWVIFESDDDIAAYKSTVKDLAARALGEEESRAFIATMAGEFGSPREDPDGAADDLAEEQPQRTK